jgi:hypothetical protein
MNLVHDSGIDMFEDFTPYVVAAGSWMLGFNWVAIAMLCVAILRLYVAWRELKLKEDNKDASSTIDKQARKTDQRRQ